MFVELSMFFPCALPKPRSNKPFRLRQVIIDFRATRLWGAEWNKVQNLSRGNQSIRCWLDIIVFPPHSTHFLFSSDPLELSGAFAATFTTFN